MESWSFFMKKKKGFSNIQDGGMKAFSVWKVLGGGRLAEECVGGHVVWVCGGVYWPSLRFLTFRHKQLREILTPQAVKDSIRGSTATVLPGLPMQRVRRSRGRAGRITCYNFGEADVNSSSELNSKRRRESPPKMFQRNPNTPARIHKTLLSPSLPFFFCSVRQVNEKNKITLCISSTPWMASLIHSSHKILGEKKTNTTPPPKIKKPGHHACLKYLPCTNFWVKRGVN